MSLLKHNSAAAILGLLLSIGMVTSAYVIGQAVFAIKATERFVTVKGFAEKKVSANVVIWPIAYTETGDDLVEVQRNLVKNKQAIIAFLKARGFDEDEITSSIPQITDYQAQGRSPNNEPRNRYSAQATQNARKAAEQFAKDSGSNVGSI